MNRREWLKSMTTLAVGVAAAPSLLAVFDAHAAAQKGGPAPQFFTPPQHDTVTAVVDIIVPRTDTPGAVDAGVPRFIDQMFKDWNGLYALASPPSYSLCLITQVGPTGIRR